MTDPEFADATYIEPLLPGPVAQVIERERPDALLGTLGGQTALNLAKALHDDGTLERFGVELIGANYEAIACAEDRELFRAAMASAGLRMPQQRDRHQRRAGERRSTAADPEARRACRASCARRSRSGGAAAGSRATREEFERIVARGIEASPIGQVLLDESVIGWGEFELEVMRDGADNVVIVCSIENVDPMGVHTGDSVTVAPQQTLTDQLYQRLRDQAIAVIRAVGVETGGSNVQFAVNPETEEILVIEMNPRVSRSSALASKATGFPIAKIAARLAVGYRLDEIDNDITGVTPACFEPTIDYVVVKWPRFAFEKFPGADPTLSTHMKSVGEAMAIGRTFAPGVRQGAALARARQDAVASTALARSSCSRACDVPGPERFETVLELLAPRRRASRRCTSARGSTRGSCASCARSRATRGRRSRASARSARSTPAPPSSPRARPTTTPAGSATATAPTRSRRGERESVVILGSGPTASARGSSSTTAACTPR